jgi:O-antigen/teichoic acid export membrane protein
VTRSSIARAPNQEVERPQETGTTSRARVASSAVWRAVETAGTELIAFAVFTVLARLLAPADFGAVAMAGAVLALMQVVLYHGFTEALIQRSSLREEHHQTVLAANLLLASGLVLFGLLAAWPMGKLLGRPELPFILAALLPSLLLRSMCSSMLAALRRDMDFRSIAIRTLLGVSVGGSIAIVLAQRGVGYWALVAQQWSAEVVSFAVLAKASPSKPWRMRWHGAELRELLPVALPVMGAQFISNAARRLDTVALGVFLSNRDVGIYFMVYRLVYSAQMVTQHGLGEVAMVVLASMNDDAERYRAALLRAMRLISFVCCCAFGLLAVAGPWLVPLVFGSAWLPAIGPLRILAAFSAAGGVVSIAGVILVASGHATSFSRLAVGAAALQLAAVFVAARWGLQAVAWTAGISQCLAVIPAVLVLGRRYQLRVSKLWFGLLPIVAVFALSLAVAFGCASALPTWRGGALGSAAFSLLMGSIGLLLWRRNVGFLTRRA